MPPLARLPLPWPPARGGQPCTTARRSRAMPVQVVPNPRYSAAQPIRLSTRGGAKAELPERRRRRMLRLDINGREQEVDADPDTPLLWVLRDTPGPTPTKYRSRIAQPGPRTLHLDPPTPP